MTESAVYSLPSMAATPSPWKMQSLENGARRESNACRLVINGKTFNLELVSPYSSGEGLLYAPEGWPNPGDIWGWKVGGRTNRAGYYQDRFLSLPRSLRKPSHTKKDLQSKPDVERYLKSNFANMEIGAFFTLFSWKVPSTKLSPAEGKLPEAGKKVIEETSIKKKLKRETQQSSQRTRKSFRCRRPVLPQVKEDANEIIDLCALNEEATEDSAEDLKGTADSASDQPSSPKSNFVAACNLVVSKEGCGMETAPEKSPIGIIVENFDDYLNTLDDILVLPHTETSSLDPLTPTTHLENEMNECRKKLSSLLFMDFSSLVSSDYLVEVASLASQLRKDPSLSVDQLIKLKLVEEIPLVSKVFKEAKGNIEEVDKFFAELEEKKLRVPCLKKEYNELKDKVAQIQEEIATSSLAIKEIDNQILHLQSKREEMCSALNSKLKRKDELTSYQTKLTNTILCDVREIQLGHLEIQNWELKKASCARHVAERYLIGSQL